MFAIFTDRARRVLNLSNQEALRLGCDQIGAEHILLGLVTEAGGVGMIAIMRAGIDPDRLRCEIEESCKKGPTSVVESELPQAPSAKGAIEFAVQESLHLNDSYVGTNHLLLGLLRDEDGAAASALRNLGVDLAAVRQVVKNAGLDT